MECIASVKQKVFIYLVFRDNVIEAVQTCLSEIKPGNKGAVMRCIAGNGVFTKKGANKVFNMLFRYR